MAGATICNISRGIIGIAILQALLAGIGLLFAGVPAAGLFSFLVLLFGIVQIGPSVIIVPLIIWSWFAMDTTRRFYSPSTWYRVNLLDNIMRPLVAKGLRTPMPVILIGVLGGMSRAWLDWSICRTDCAFDRLAVARGLERRCADTHGRGWVRPDMDLALAGGMIPDDRELLADLTGVEYGYVLREGRDAIILEKKVGYEETPCLTRSCRRPGFDVCLPGGGIRPSLAAHRQAAPPYQYDPFSRPGPDGCDRNFEAKHPAAKQQLDDETHDATAQLGVIIRSKRRMLPQSRPN